MRRLPTLTTPVFDHVSLGVSELERSALFYDAALAPLGLVALFHQPRAVGYGPAGFEGEAPFAILQHEDAAPCAAMHLAWIATSRDAVDAFHAAALRHGGTCEGPPGIREPYDPGYYAAFVRDLDGHRLEAVLHE